jgi:hypothetical protein
MAKMTKARRAEMLLEQMKDLNYNPLDQLIQLAKHSQVDAKTKVRIATELMQYMYPKQKAVEIDHNQGQAVTFNFDLSGAEPTGSVVPDVDYSKDA